MFRISTKLAALAVAGAVAVSLAACGTAAPDPENSGEAPGEITIGFVGSLTGPLASSGVNALAGLKAGAEYAESKYPNLTVNIEERDTAGEATAAVAQTRELAQAGVSAIYYTTEAFPAVQGTLNQVKIPGGTAGGIGPILSDTGDNRLYKYAFSTGAGTSGETSILPYLDYLSSIGDTIGVLDDSSAFNASQSALLDKIVAASYPDVKLVHQSFPSNASDATAQLAALQNADVDSLILFSYGAPAVTAMTSLGKLGWTPPMAAELGLGADATVALIPPAMNDLIAAGPIANTFMTAQDPDSITAQFVKLYQKAQSKETFGPLDTVGAISFDWAVIVSQAVEESGSTNGDDIKNYLTAGNPLEGANGTYVFGPDVRIGISADQLSLFNPSEKCDPSGVCVAPAAAK
jgi:branched-chain amino acid transport system substrate-binding protein